MSRNWEFGMRNSACGIGHAELGMRNWEKEFACVKMKKAPPETGGALNIVFDPLQITCRGSLASTSRHPTQVRPYAIQVELVGKGRTGRCMAKPKLSAGVGKRLHRSLVKQRSLAKRILEGSELLSDQLIESNQSELQMDLSQLKRMVADRHQRGIRRQTCIRHQRCSRHQRCIHHQIHQ